MCPCGWLVPLRLAIREIDYAITPGSPAIINRLVLRQTKTLMVPIVGDSAYEAVEQFFVRLQNATGGVLISDAQGTGTISDDEGRKRSGCYRRFVRFVS